jgi:nicotinamidase-related amidase
VSLADYADDKYVQWPPHCQQRTFAARFDPYLRMPNSSIVVKKGFLVRNDSYSAYGGRESVQGAPFDTQDDSTDLGPRDDLKALVERHGIERLWVMVDLISPCVVVDHESNIRIFSRETSWPTCST